MRLIDQLNQVVNPLPSADSNRERQTRKQWQRATQNANILRRVQAVEKYRAVWEQEWEATTTIDSRLGQSRCTALPTLRDWEAAGLVESREKIPGVRKHGLEWRWLK